MGIIFAVGRENLLLVSSASEFPMSATGSGPPPRFQRSGCSCERVSERTSSGERFAPGAALKFERALSPARTQTHTHAHTLLAHSTSLKRAGADQTNGWLLAAISPERQDRLCRRVSRERRRSRRRAAATSSGSEQRQSSSARCG